MGEQRGLFERPIERPVPSSMLSFPTISLQQPFATALLEPHPKDAENRTWPLPAQFIGKPMLLHAGKALYKMPPDSWEWLASIWPTMPPVAELPRGVAIGIIIFDRVVRPSWLHGNPWAGGPLCWMRASSTPLREPVPLRGFQKVFTATVPADVVPIAYGGTWDGR